MASGFFEIPEGVSMLLKCSRVWIKNGMADSSTRSVLGFKEYPDLTGFRDIGARTRIRWSSKNDRAFYAKKIGDRKREGNSMNWMLFLKILVMGGGVTFSGGMLLGAIRLWRKGETEIGAVALWGIILFVVLAACAAYIF